MNVFKTHKDAFGRSSNICSIRKKKVIGTHNRGTAISITVQEPLCNTKADRQISAAIISALSIINFRTLGEYVHWRFLILAMCSVN